eukprot:Gb_35700 [translate_table: standard]
MALSKAFVIASLQCSMSS